jgi:hypothetical protein
VLLSNGTPIASSAYYEARALPNSREHRDEQLNVYIERVQA